MKTLARLGVCAFLLVGLSVFMGCAAHRQSLIVKNFTSSGSPCWDALVINQVAAGCTSVTLKKHVTHTLIYCETYKDGSDPANPWLVNDFYIIEPSPATVQFDRPVHAMCADPAYMLLWGEKAPFEPEFDLQDHPRLD
jgi:hypothetical protein